MIIKLPRVFSVNISIEKNSLRNLILESQNAELDLVKFSSGKISGFLSNVNEKSENEILFIRKVKDCDFSPFTHVILLNSEIPYPPPEYLDLTEAIWLKHPLTNTAITPDIITASWKNGFNYVEEDEKNKVIGLRKPQLGAIHAALSHWSVNNETATIVMPTGTGKTETMLSILISGKLNRLLVIVPTDALRSQISEKFLTLGMLKSPQAEILSPTALNPVVGVIEHKFKEVENLRRFLNHTNVVITTSQMIGSLAPEVQNIIVEICTYLFIDEAHHSEAPTWKSFKTKYDGKNIIQFTATPFREDEKLIDGSIIFKYPLKKAQEDGYFKPIDFEPVMEFNPSQYDLTIAKKAIEVLQADETGKHILMARVQTIQRAIDVGKIYKDLYEGEVAVLHSGLTQAKRQDAIRRLLSGNTKIVVCVDMLGEGFDLPELKIAAFHDIKKSLAITLQLAGRFTRTRHDLGNATFIANLANIDVKDELRTLYSQDPDWNVLLPKLSERIIEDQIFISKFTDDFKSYPKEIPLNNIFPATSSVIYKTDCERWTPDQFKKSLNLSPTDYVNYSINEVEKTLVIIVGRYTAVEWANWDEIRNWNYELYVLTWLKDSNVLLIHSSHNSGVFKPLANAVCGLSATLITGDVLFRTLAEVKRLRLTNIGLSETIGNLISYTGRMGNDVETGLTEVQKKRSRKSVIFGAGYENGSRTSIGASKKGRVWSFKRSNLAYFNVWAKNIARKVLDVNINPQDVLKGTLQAKIVFARPSSMPINIDWPEEIYTTLEQMSKIRFGNEESFFHDVSINLISPSSEQSSDLLFEIINDLSKSVFKLRIFSKIADGQTEPESFFKVEQVSGSVVSINNKAADLYFSENPPKFWFSDGSSLEGNHWIPLNEDYVPYDKEKFAIWDWTNVDLSKEAQGIKPETDSIQYKVIHHLLSKGMYDIIFDDDGSGEIADVISVFTENKDETLEIHVELYHCKYAKSGKPAARIDDLYEVCGQAQKSIHWVYDQMKSQDLFVHMLKREVKKNNGGESKRLIFGTKDKLFEIKEQSREARVRMSIYVVQPGLSKNSVSPSQLELLSITENYLHETFRLPFKIICSA